MLEMGSAAPWIRSLFYFKRVDTRVPLCEEIEQWEPGGSMEKQTP